MPRFLFYSLASLVLIQFALGIPSTPCLAQEWAIRGKPQGTLKVVDLWQPAASLAQNYAQGLMMLDRENRWVLALAEDYRWVNDRTIEFKLREAVRFHNGERFNAEAVKVNWEAYKDMETPRPYRFTVLPDETAFQIVDEYQVRFTFPEPDGLVFVKFGFFFLFAPEFFTDNSFEEKNWGYLSEAGPWGTGPFKLVEGNALFVEYSDRAVLEANEGYWELGYPKVEKVIFENKLIGDRKEAMRLCREEEGVVDIVSHIRPLDTLKVAESPFAKVVKSRDVGVLFGRFNQRKEKSKWRDIRLRKALNYAVNREELWKYAAKGNAYNVEGFLIPPGAYGHNPNLAHYTYDTDKARTLLAEAGYANGFKVKMITQEAWKLEAQIIGKMLERIGLKAVLEVLTHPELYKRVYIPSLNKPVEEQDWDIYIMDLHDAYGHTGAVFLTFGYIEESDFRWIEYDPVYEKMWGKAAKIVDFKQQEDLIRGLVKYTYEHAHDIVVYSPLLLYAVNKEFNFVPQKSQFLRFKETSVTDNHWSVREKTQ